MTLIKKTDLINSIIESTNLFIIQTLDCDLSHHQTYTTFMPVGLSNGEIEDLIKGTLTQWHDSTLANAVSFVFHVIQVVMRNSESTVA